MIGKRLGHYEIVGPLGAGGMGEVYRARDSKLKREVAIKVLPQELADDEDRLARLEREAHLLASLNHPNIATIFSLDEIDGIRFLVLELIDGESLQQRLERGPLPVADAMDICGQVARALEVAHEADIVHRDLKPANVLITRDDRAKVLDFGIAKTLRPLEGGDPTAQATELTMAGTLVGTAPYMSPEQVRGEAVDKRTDVWAFGCLFFETLSGTGPFTRETVADTLAAIVGDEPHWESLPADVSPAVRLLLHRCLQKSPKVRQRDIGDAWVEINQSLSHPGGVPMSMPPTIAGDVRGLRRGVVATLIVGALAAGAFAGWWAAPEPPPPVGPVYFTVGLPEGGVVPEGSGPALAISPDGDKIAFVAEGAGGEFTRQLFVHRLDQPGGPQVLTRSEGAEYPFFSPDGSMLAFNAPEGTIEAVSLDGGDRENVCRQCMRGAWGDDGIIALSTDPSLGSTWVRIPAPGAPPEALPVPRLDGAVVVPYRVHVLPGGRAVLFERQDADIIYAFSLETSELVEVAINASDPYYAGGHVLFPRDFTLYAVPFDVGSLRVTGVPFVAHRQIRTEPAGALHAGVSSVNGVLAYIPAPTQGNSLGWVSRTGDWEEIVADDLPNIWVQPRVSPNGGRIALGVGGPRSPGIYFVDESARALEPFLEIDRVEISYMGDATWSRDGSSITVYVRRPPDREGAIVRKRLGGSGAVETLLGPAPFAVSRSWAPAGWTPDGGLIYGVRGQPPRLLVPAPGAPPVSDSRLFEGDSGTSRHALTYDGKWLAYTSERLGSEVAFVRSFPDGEEIRVSPASGTEPRWARGDDELFYVDGNRLMSARLRIEGDRLDVESVEMLFDVSEYPAVASFGRYDVHPDGTRFVVVRPNSIDDAPRITVVLNWLDGLAGLAGEER